MQILDHLCPTPQENVALDEALLLEAEASPEGCEVLRLWEPEAPMVVVGRASRVAEEVDLEACRERSIPVLRRESGGATILAAPGCLMYAVVLSYDKRPALRGLDELHRFVLGRLHAAVARIVPDVECRGICDLALGGRKVSGNSVRCRRDHALYHGTLLHDASIELIAACLKMPSRQPDYRAGRDHARFLTNLPADPSALRRALVAAWSADEPRTAWPESRTRRLVEEKYSQAEWSPLPG